VFVFQFLSRKSSKFYIFWVWVCTPSLPACSAHAPYCHLWPVCVYHNFPLYFTNGTILGNNLFNTKVVLILSTTLSETCFILELNVRRSFMLDTSYYNNVLKRIGFSRQVFEKSSNIKFHENPFHGSRIVPCGRTDRQTDVTKLLVIVAFLDYANPPKNSIVLMITLVHKPPS